MCSSNFWKSENVFPQYWHFGRNVVNIEASSFVISAFHLTWSLNTSCCPYLCLPISPLLSTSCSYCFIPWVALMSILLAKCSLCSSQLCSKYSILVIYLRYFPFCHCVGVWQIMVYKLWAWKGVYKLSFFSIVINKVTRRENFKIFLRFSSMYCCLSSTG